MKTLYAFGDLYDAYNESVKDKSVMKIPSSFFNAIEGCDTESRLLANIDSRVLKLDWRSAEYGRGLSCFLLSRATLLSPPLSPLFRIHLPHPLLSHLFPSPTSSDPNILLP